MPLLHRTGGMGAKGFGLTSVNTFSFIATISSNTTSYNLVTAATAAGWNGVAPIIANITINSGVSIAGTGDTTSSAFLLTSTIPTKSIITLTNNGTIYGAGGSAGYNVIGGYYQEAGNADGAGYGGDVPNNPYGDSGGYPPYNGTSGGGGYTAIYMTTNCTFNIYNYGTITGGGGGGGGGGSNNAGGGNGGNGGIALVETGTPTVTLYNQTGAIFGGGGGGGSGWGNRSEGATEGGSVGNNAIITYNGGGNFGALGSAGRSSTNNATTLFSGAGTHTL
jgi:hypothetical protein